VGLQLAFNYMCKYILVALFGLSIESISFAQTTSAFEHSANILPPSPTATELGKYGLVPVGFSTGTPSIQIPLHQFATKHLSVPLTLTYSSSGVKVDQLASWVGMNWSLESGGVITRVVRDVADDDANYELYPENFNSNNPQALEYLQRCADEQFFDSEPDLFTFNFSGYTGKFLFDRSGKAIVMPFQNIKISRSLDTSTEESVFTITTPDGIIYTFGESETSKTGSVGAECGRSYEHKRETSWYLTQVSHPTGEVIYLEYEGSVYSYPFGVTQNITRKLARTGSVSVETQCPDQPSSTCVNTMYITGRYLKRIWSSSFGEIEFVATKTRTDLDDYKLDGINIKSAANVLLKSFSFDYTFSTATQYSNSLTTEELKHRMFLTAVHEKDSNGTGIRSHSFEYNDINGLPPRLSFAQDHWGYFNGRTNQYFVPVDAQEIRDEFGRKVFTGIGGNREPAAVCNKGLLTKVTYPTGGFTTLLYEPNTYRGYNTIIPTPVSLQQPVQGTGFKTTVTKTLSFTPNINQFMVFSLNNSPSAEYDSEDDVDPLHHIAQMTVRDLTTSTIIYSGTAEWESTISSDDIQVYGDHSYQVSVSATGEIVSAYFSSSYLPSQPTQVPANMITGGLRVLRTVNHDALTGQDEMKSYYYEKIASPGISSGQTTVSPIYYAASMIHLPGVTTGTALVCSYATLYSSSQFNLYPLNGSNVFYQYVTTVKGTDFSQGADEHEFTINPDIDGQLVWGFSNILNASSTNSGWDNGLEKRVRYYKQASGNLVLLKETENTYVSDTRNQSEVKALVVRKKYTPVLVYNTSIACNDENRTKIYYDYKCIADHSHWWVFGFGDNVNCVAPGADNRYVAVGQHPCYGRTEDVVTLPYALDHLDAIEYRNIAYWHYLSSARETTYDENGQHPITNLTEYFYDNPIHSFLGRVKKTTSDGKVSEERMKYIGDYNELGNFTILKNKHIVNSPIKQEKFVDNILTEGSLITLTDNGSFQDLYLYESEAAETVTHDPAVLIPSQYKWKASYAYDGNQNLKTVSSREGVRKDYIWGYNAAYPIAEIVQSTNDHFAYTSFEQDGTGNWTVPSASRENSGYTGLTSYSLASGAISKSVDNTKVYAVSFWAQSSNVTVNGVAPVAGETTNGWTYFTATVQTATTIIISGSSIIDELRLCNRTAQMKTYTYMPGVGVKSITDPNNRTTFFDYDTHGRLKSMKDGKGDIIKSFEYNYVNR
jgi:YD repeat-containing protein